MALKKKLKKQKNKKIKLWQLKKYHYQISRSNLPDMDIIAYVIIRQKQAKSGIKQLAI
jgi:hypothetical protein